MQMFFREEYKLSNDADKNRVFCQADPICRYFDLGEVDLRNYIISLPL